MTESSFVLPTSPQMELGKKLMQPFYWLHRPAIFGWEEIPEDRPLLFVGNHTIYGMIDAPVMFLELYEQKGIFLRSLGDHLHFQIPVWRDFLQRFGVVQGTRENCGALMEQGESILVFPGGGREVAKKKGEKYKLIWKERMGFARMAIQHRCTIVPFAAVGVEDMFEILLDSDHLMRSPLGRILEQFPVRTDVIMPIAMGAGPLKLPRLERLYFQFAPAIPTDSYDGDFEDRDKCWELREQTRHAVEGAIGSLLEIQRRDPDRWFEPSLPQLASLAPGWLKDWGL